MIYLGPGTDGKWRVAREGRGILETVGTKEEAIAAACRLRVRGETISTKRHPFTVVGGSVKSKGPSSVPTPTPDRPAGAVQFGALAAAILDGNTATVKVALAKAKPSVPLLVELTSIENARPKGARKGVSSAVEAWAAILNE